MLFRVRKVLGVTVMAVSAVGLALINARSGCFAPNLAGLWVVVAALVLGTVGLATGAWWGRLIPLAWSTSVAAAAGVALVDKGDGEVFALAVLFGALFVGGCLSGREMFGRYEGKAPPPLDWTSPGMPLIRAALIANIHGFLASVALTPVVYEWSQWSQGRWAASGTQSVLSAHAGMTVLVLVGLVQLARQRTAGLLLLALSTLAVPVILATHLRLFAGGGGTQMLLVVFVPGILCGWLALGRFVPGMVRLLRR